MAAKSTDIKTLIVNRISALGLVQAVYDYEELNPSGWPAAWVLDTDLTGQFTDTAHNRRIYAIKVTVMMFLGQDYEAQGSQVRERYIENTLSDTVDSIINDIDDNFELDGVTILFIDAADYRKGIIDTPQGEAKAVEVTLLVNTDYNVTS